MDTGIWITLRICELCAYQVKVHYTGKLKDGTEFDTSAGRGKTEASSIIATMMM